MRTTGLRSTPGHLVRFCHTREITLTRSRPYHKNDNSHVEEKNDSVIRKFVGYDRHDSQTEIDLLNRLYRSLHLLVNWFLLSQELLSKVRTGSHITKVYDQAQTPENFRPIPRGCSCIRGVYSEGCCPLCQDAGTDGCSRRDEEASPGHSCRAGPDQSRSTPRIGPTSSGAP